MAEAQQFVDYIKEKFYSDYLDGLKEFVRIPSLNPIFDPEWQTNKALDKQCDHLVNFVKSQDLKGVEIHPLKEEGRTPFLIVKIEPFNTTSEDTVLMYGHMDKQPFGDGWDTDPCEPVLKDGKLFGRGSHDDGYALFSSVLAVKACQYLNKSHPRIVITIEGSEEGEIFDLLHYLKTYKQLLGKPDLVICLDAGAHTIDSITLTTSLRGVVMFDVTATALTNNFHSGIGGGLLPNPYSILTTLYERIHDPKTQTDIPELQVDIPPHRLEEIDMLADIVPGLFDNFPTADGVQKLGALGANGDKKKELVQCIKKNYWGSAASVIGIKGMPNDLNDAGNVIYKELTFRFSIRLGPTLPASKAMEIVKSKMLKENDEEMFGAKIEVKLVDEANGMDCPDLPQKYKKSLYEATAEVFGEGQKPIFAGCGGAIPFMEIFQQEFPEANFMLTGVAFPDSFAHSANENIDLEYCRKLTTGVSLMLSKF